MGRKKAWTAALWGVSLCAVGLCCFLLGKGTAPAEEPEATAAFTAPTEPPPTELRVMPEASDGEFRLKLGVTFLPDGEDSAVSYCVKGADEDSEGLIEIYDAQSVSISVDGETLFLEDAIQSDRITLEEMFAYARLDARDSLCKQWSETKNGLTYFNFRYPEYDVRFAYDIYEVPDGGEYLVNEMLLCKNIYTVATLIDPDIDREDWGLSFEAVSATGTTLTLHCEQSGGQQIGELITYYYYIDPADYSEVIPTLTREQSDYQPMPGIPSDAESEITIDWTNIYGELPPGDYVMSLRVKDQYDPENVHPLMRNFHDVQAYDIPFSIP